MIEPFELRANEGGGGVTRRLPARTRPRLVSAAAAAAANISQSFNNNELHLSLALNE